MTTPDLPDYDALDALVDEDPIKLRDIAWQLRTRLGAYERLETAARALLRLKTGPRDEAYHEQKPWAWAALSDALDALPAPEVTP